MDDKLEKHLIDLAKYLGWDKQLPSDYDEIDKLDWHLKNIKNLVKSNKLCNHFITISCEGNPTLNFTIACNNSEGIDNSTKLYNTLKDGKYIFSTKQNNPNHLVVSIESADTLLLVRVLSSGSFDNIEYNYSDITVTDVVTEL